MQELLSLLPGGVLGDCYCDSFGGFDSYSQTGGTSGVSVGYWGQVGDRVITHAQFLISNLFNSSAISICTLHPERTSWPTTGRQRYCKLKSGYRQDVLVHSLTVAAWNLDF